MPDQPQETGARRRYSDDEAAAFRACGMNPMYGPAQFAGGRYWPDELERRADRMEKCARQIRESSRRLDGGICRVNRCGRPLGIGTYMTITGYGRAADQTLPVCEDHWQALRDILPVESSRG